MYLLDTNHCSRILLGDEVIGQKIRQVGDSLLFTNIIVAGELIFMAEKSKLREKNLAKVKAFLATINLYFLTEETANIYAQVKAKVLDYFGPKEKAKRRKFNLNQLGISDQDLWIVATAIQQQLILVSRDEDFLRIQQVQEFFLENWI